MKRLTLAFLLLGFCASSSVAMPAPQSNRQTLGGSKCNMGLNECKESLNEFKDAEQFMQLKAIVLADLSRLEGAASTKSKIAPVRHVDANRQRIGSGVVYSATVGPNRISYVQSTRAAQPVSLKITMGTPIYKRTP